MNKKFLISGVTGMALSVGLIGYGVFNSNGNPTPVAHAQGQVHVTQPVMQNSEENKTKIQNMMLNSIDYFQKAKGSFEYMTSDYTLLVDYQVDQSENNPKSFEKVKTLASVNSSSPDFVDTELSLYDGDSIETAYTIAKTKETKKEKFKVKKVSKEEKDATKNSTIKDRLIVMNGETSFIRKADPAYMGVAATSLLPQDFAGGFMEDPTNWDIVGNEEVAGVQTVVIEGTLNEYYSGKYNGGNFKLNVDPNTGILLQMEVKDKSGKLKRSLKTSSIKINGTLDESSFVIE